MLFNSEKDFSRALRTRLSKHGFMTTRIETHGTVNGMPDLYVCGFGYDCFIELKNDKQLSMHDKNIKVQWRPGQQSWMLEYYIKHVNKKCCLTIVAVEGGYYIIPMTCVYQRNTVFNAQNLFISDKDWRKINLPRVLHALTTNMMGYHTYREAIIDLVEQFYCPDIDYCPDSLWTGGISVDDTFDSTVFNNAKFNILVSLEYM